MEITINLDILWMFAGIVIVAVVYILTTIGITDRADAVRWIWGAVWLLVLIMSTNVLYESLGDNPSNIDAIPLTASVLLGLVHITACFGQFLEM